MSEALCNIQSIVYSMKVKGDYNSAAQANALEAIDKVIAKYNELEQCCQQLQEENSSKTRFENEIKEIVKEVVQRSAKPKT